MRCPPATAKTSDPATATEVMFTAESSRGGSSCSQVEPSKCRIVPNAPTAHPSPEEPKATLFNCNCVAEMDCGSSLHAVPFQRTIVPNWPTATAVEGLLYATLSRLTCEARGGRKSTSHPLVGS